MPLFTTPTQFAVCALLLVAGWFLGLASHPGGRKWKERYAAERDAHAANRREWEAQHAARRTDADDRVVAANNRVAELERENERLRSAAPVTAQTIAPRERTTFRPAAASAARPAYPADEKRGWFDFGNRG